MTTPTREQVIASFIAEFEPMGYEMDLAKCQCCTFASDGTQHAFMGFTAGREQGLREAKEVCDADGFVEQFRGLNEATRRIEQLRGK